MRKLSGAILCLIAIFALFSAPGCSTSDGGEVVIMFDIEDEGRYDEFIAAFEAENPDIKIKPVYGLDIVKLINTPNEPDLIKTSNVRLETDKNMLTDLTPFISKDPRLNEVDFNPIIMDALKIDGKLYALPTSINTSLLYYNVDMFDEHADEIRAALDLGKNESVYPQKDWTYDDFMKAGVAMTKYSIKNGVRIYSQYGAETESRWWGEWLIYVRHYGGDFYKKDNLRKSGLNTPEAIKGTEFMYKKCRGDDEEKFAPTTLDNELSFASGKVAMIFGGHIGNWASYNALGLNWDIQVLPTPPEHPDARGGEISADAYGINFRSKKKEAAYKFLSYWLSRQGAALQFKFGRISARNDMPEIIEQIKAEDPSLANQNPKNINAVFEASAIALPLPREKDFEIVCRQYVMDKIQIMLDENSGFTPAMTMQRAAAAVDAYYANLYG